MLFVGGYSQNDQHGHSLHSKRNYIDATVRSQLWRKICIGCESNTRAIQSWLMDVATDKMR